MQVPLGSVPDPPGPDKNLAVLAHRAHFPLLGRPLTVRSNSPEVVGAAALAFGHWTGLKAEFIDSGPALDLALVVRERRPGAPAPAPFRYQVHGDCLLAAGGGNLLAAHRGRGWAWGLVAPELVAAAPLFREQVLECLALALASRRDRTPVHAAAVSRRGCALLLVGPSLAGKSTLSYACQREGFRWLAEDAVYVSTQGGVRLWSHSRRIYLEPGARRLFPELAGLPVETRGNGKVKLAVAPARPPGPEPYCGKTIVCLLRRHGGRRSALQPLEAPALAAALQESPEPGFVLDPRMPAVVAGLAREGAYLLIHGRHLEETVALLKGLTN